MSQLPHRSETIQESLSESLSQTVFMSSTGKSELISTLIKWGGDLTIFN